MYSLDQLEVIEDLLEDSIERNNYAIKKGGNILPIDVEVLGELKNILFITQSFIKKEETPLGNREIEVILSSLDELGCSVGKIEYTSEKDRESYLKEISELELYLGKVLSSRGGWGNY